MTCLFSVLLPVLAVNMALLTAGLCADTAPHQIDCVGEKDGLHEIGCWGYANCRNNTPEVHACPSGTVLERDNMTCIKPGDGKTDCYLPTECSGKADGRYADPGDSCVTFYRCLNQINLGRFYCPADTAFNEKLQICDFPINLEPPCGTKKVSSPSIPDLTIIG